MAAQERASIDAGQGASEVRQDEVRTSTVALVAGNIAGFGLVAYAVVLLDGAQESASLALTDALFAAQIALVGLAVLVGATTFGLLRRIDRN